MKTIQEVQDKIGQLENSDRRLFTHDEMKERTDEAIFLRQIKYYLETEPTEEFVKSEVARLEEKLRVIDEKFPAWLSRQKDQYSMSEKQWRNAYNKEMGVKITSNQLDNLKFILA